MIPKGMARYGELCSSTLARAYARSGDRIAIASYLRDAERSVARTYGVWKEDPQGRGRIVRSGIPTR